MNTYLKKNINTIISIFILISPIIDLITGISLHYNYNFTLGIIMRIIFLLLICYISVFIYKKKKLLIPYSIIVLYFILYILGIILYKDQSVLFLELQRTIKVFYFPIMLLSIYSIKDEIKVSKLVLLVTLFLYLFSIFIPTILNLGYKSYQITKKGTLGFFNSANEISGIISILTPIMFILLKESKSKFSKVFLIIMYLTVILMMGTKSPLLSLLITIMFSLIYFWIYSIKHKNYKNILISLIVVVIFNGLLIVIVPKTNFDKNIRTHLKFLHVKDIVNVVKDEKLIDHFIFSQRLTFLNNKAYRYKESNTYEKVLGIGYYDEGKEEKLIEMDYFDIYYSHGIIGFTIVFSITLYVLYKILDNKKTKSFEELMITTSLFLIVLLSFFTGHIITSPSVSLLCVIIIISLEKRKKKDLLFASYNLDLGGIEKALLNLTNRIDKEKYNVTIVLEKKEGLFLNNLDNNIVVKELKVSENNSIIIRKTTNFIRKLFFKILNYNNYDFSCCYATYSYSSSKIALMTSSNNSLYIHSSYEYIYDEEGYKEFFETRNIYDYKHLIFVSNEARNAFLDYYSDLKSKTLVFNNFVDVNEIKSKSNEDIKVNKKYDKLFVFVGRLDDSSKKLSRAINIIDKTKDTELWLIGDGPDRKKYENEVKELKLEKRITFLGKKSNPYPYMKKADYILLTSDYEGFPVTYLEALVLKKDIVTTIITSDNEINIKDYSYIISKDKEKSIKEINTILKDNKSLKRLDLEEIQNNRMKELEKIFNN